MIKCIIVDDEKPARDELRYILGKYDNIEIVAEASNAIEALKINEDMDIDLMFLDIKMPQMSGIELARILMDKEKSPNIVFVTAYDQFALKAFEVNAIDYLLKPIDEKQLKKSFDNKIYPMIENNLESKKEIKKLLDYIDNKGQVKLDKITGYLGNKMVPLNFMDIVYITVEDKETVIYSKKNRYTIPFTLNNIMEKLDDKIFFRSHKSFIVNIEYIDSIEEWFNSTLNLKMKFVEDKVPVSRSNIKEFKCIMNMY